MATDEAKKENALRMALVMLQVLTSEVYDTLGESSMALANGMGEAMLAMFEKEQGLEVGGEDPIAIGKEVDRILVDEYGFADEIALVPIETGVADIKVKACRNTFFCDKMLVSGMKTPFICPAMLTCKTALVHMGFKEQITYERWQEGKGCIFHFRRLSYNKPA
jgi:hypothetical protein